MTNPVLSLCLLRPRLVLRVITNIIDAEAETDQLNPLLQPTRFIYIIISPRYYEYKLVQFYKSFQYIEFFVCSAK